MEVEIGSKLNSEKFGVYEVLEILPQSKVRIRFKSTGYEYVCYKSQAKSSQVKDLLHPSVCGVGFVGGEAYNWTKDRTAYDAWANMLKRCYSPYRLEIRPSYSGCTVDKSWHNFQVFAQWYYTHVLPIPCHIDKDLLSKECRTYSQETCCFLPSEVNVALLGGRKVGKDSGVFYREKDRIYIAQIHRNKKLEYLGCFKNSESAKMAYNKAKKEWLAELAEIYEDVLDARAYSALHFWNPT